MEDSKRMIELFSGHGSMSKEFKDNGYETLKSKVELLLKEME